MSSLDDILMSSLYNGGNDGNRKHVFLYVWDLGSTRIPLHLLCISLLINSIGGLSVCLHLCTQSCHSAQIVSLSHVCLLTCCLYTDLGHRSAISEYLPSLNKD